MRIIANVITIGMMKKKTPPGYLNISLKVLDIPVILLAAALTLIVGITVYSKETASSQVIIRGPDKAWVFPMDAEEQVLVSGFIGETKVKISEGRAQIVSSPCSGQTCVAAVPLRKNRQWAACLPNGVFLLIEGAEGKNAIDAVSW